MTIGRKCNRKHNYVGRNRITDNAVCRIAAQELGLFHTLLPFLVPFNFGKGVDEN